MHKIEQDYQTHIQFQVDQDVTSDPAVLQRAVAGALPRFNEEVQRQLQQDRGWKTQVHSSIKLHQ